MLFHYLKFAIRHFKRDKLFSIINVLGLTLGIGVSVVLLAFLQDSLTYDQSHLKHNRIYRLGSHLTGPGVEFKSGKSARELGEILKSELPEVQDVVRIESWNHVLVRYQNTDDEIKTFYEENIVNADSNYFKVFTHQFIYGNQAKCLTSKNSVVFTESIAKKYFGEESPINKLVEIDNESRIVTAVIRDLPENLHLKFDIIVSKIEDRPWVSERLIRGERISEAFWNPDIYTYILMSQKYDPSNFYSKFSKINEQHIKPFGDQIGGTYEAVLEPLDRIHFHSLLDDDEVKGNIAYLYALTGSGLFIILLSCINYVNLSTAKSIKRATEICIKKTLGSNRRSLLTALMMESIILSLIAFGLALLAIMLFANFSSIIPVAKGGFITYFLNNPMLLFSSLGVCLIIGSISGLYPALYLTAIPVTSGLKGKGSYKSQKSNLILRNSLIGFQFFISVLVVACTLFMSDQIEYMRNHDLGFDSRNIIAFPIEDTGIKDQLEAFKNGLLEHSSISNITTTHDVMGKNTGTGVLMAESEAGMLQQKFTILSAGDDYIQTLGIKLILGRDIKQEPTPKAKGTREFIVNETTVRIMGWSDPIGKKLKFFHDEKDGEVVGVVKDFNYTSLHNTITPVVIAKSWDSGGDLLIKYSGTPSSVVDFAREQWKTYDTRYPFEYYFLDKRFNDQYKEEEGQYALLNILSNICLFISFLGLLSLSAFAATQRTKEIGIRKVLGANVSTIIYLLYSNIMMLLILAIILAIPISLLVTNEWLANFAYKGEINYYMFVQQALIALVATFAVVLLQSLSSVRANPVDSLKCE